jgi:hypothetical protein
MARVTHVNSPFRIQGTRICSLRSIDSDHHGSPAVASSFNDWLRFP